MMMLLDIQNTATLYLQSSNWFDITFIEIRFHGEEGFIGIYNFFKITTGYNTYAYC